MTPDNLQRQRRLALGSHVAPAHFRLARWAIDLLDPEPLSKQWFIDSDDWDWRIGTAESIEFDGLEIIPFDGTWQVYMGDIRVFSIETVGQVRTLLHLFRTLRDCNFERDESPDA